MKDDIAHSGNVWRFLMSTVPFNCNVTDRKDEGIGPGRNYEIHLHRAIHTDICGDEMNALKESASAENC